MNGSTSGGGVRRRALYTGGALELSTLTLSVGPVGPGAVDVGAVGLLRKALEAGITTFDMTDAPDPALADALLARAFPSPDPRIVVLCSGRPAGRARDPGSSAPPRPPGVSTPDSPRGRRGGPGRFYQLPEVEVSDLSGPEDGPGAGLPPRVALPSTPFVARCRSLDDVELAARLPPPRILSGPFSLLERALPAAAMRRLGRDGFSWIARDPFAGGRLDGTLFARGSPVAPIPQPRTVRELEAEFGPVARLGFLARPRRRTLAQAALHFVVDTPGVVTACLGIPPVERWDEIVGFGGSPPLDDEELKQVVSLPGAERDRVASEGHRR